MIIDTIFVNRNDTLAINDIGIPSIQTETARKTEKKSKGFYLNILIFICVYGLLSALLFIPEAIGVADNGDYLRTMEVFGILPSEDTSYFSFQSDYIISSPKTAGEYGLDIFRPIRSGTSDYRSSQFLFIKTALFFNAIYNALCGVEPARFNLIIQTCIYLFCYALAITALLKRKWLASKVGNWVFKIVFLIMFLDTGYLMYFNSFFGEATTYIFLVASFVMLLALERQRENVNKLSIYLFLIFSIWMFSGSKAANFPSAVLLCAALLVYILRYEKTRRKLILSAMLAIMLVSAFMYASRAPEWMDKVTTFQSVFFGILKDTTDTDEILKEMDIPPELACLESTDAYSVTDYDIYGEEFEKLFYDKVSKADVLRYYLRHPAILTDKLKISAEAALPLRATYLSNYDIGNEHDLVFANKFNVWENIRKQFSGYAFIAFVIIILLSAANLFFNKADAYSFSLRLALILCAMGQFVVPVIGNGEADLMKHMFLYNIHIDILIILLIYDNIESCVRHYRFSFAAAAVLAIVIMISLFKAPETVTYGHIGNTPIEWYVIEKKDGYVKLISKDILYNIGFDESDNLLFNSDIEKSLIKKTDEWFTADEKSQIKRNAYPLVLSRNNADIATAGDRPHFWFSGVEYAERNIGRAFRCTYYAYITLPSVSDVKQLHDVSGNTGNTDEQYWLRTPWISKENFVRVAAPDNQVYHRNVKNILGVRPVMWVKSKSVLQASGFGGNRTLPV